MEPNVPSELTVDARRGWSLREATPADAEAVTSWLADERVHRWWGGAPVSSREVQEKYTGGRAPGVVVLLVVQTGEPVGLVQVWWEDEQCGLDMFLAAHAQGRGLGPAAARALAEDLTARGWTGLTVDPAVDNDRAVRAWRRAGFAPTGRRGVDDGHATEVMVFVPGTATAHEGAVSAPRRRPAS